MRVQTKIEIWKIAQSEQTSQHVSFSDRFHYFWYDILFMLSISTETHGKNGVDAISMDAKYSSENARLLF